VKKPSDYCYIARTSTATPVESIHTVYPMKHPKRSHGKSSTSSLPRTKNQESKKSIKDWNYYICSAKQASEYEATTEFLVDHIKETFEFGGNIAMTIVK
jgi:hypothetical protein